jgi:hypothetical protein
MAVTIANDNASLQHKVLWGGGDVLVAILLLPVIKPVRRRARGAKLFMVCGIAVMSLVALTTLSGCGTGNGFLGQVQKSYTLTLIGTATGSNGATLQHIATVTLTVQ